MKKLLIISLSNLKRDPRVHKQICALKNLFEVATIGYQDSGEGVTFYPACYPKQDFIGSTRTKTLSLFGSYGLIEDNIVKSLKLDMDRLFSEKFDIIYANDVDSLPVAFRISHGSRIILDAHEYSPEEHSDSFSWRIFLRRYKIYLCRKYLKRVDRMITVSDGVAEEYNKNFGIRPDIITNAARYHALKPSHGMNNHIKMVHHGIASPQREIELMIKLMDDLDERFSLDLMLVPLGRKRRYYEFLKKISAGKSRVRIIDPVPMQQIVGFTNNYDAGLYLLPTKTLNTRYALPNKFFEYIQARLAVFIGPSPEMARIVNKYECGVVSGSFDLKTLAGELNSLTKEQIMHYKIQSDKAAFELSAERQLERLKEIVSGV